VRRGENGVPGTRAAAPVTPGCGTLPTDCHARSRHAQYPLASTVAARNASRDRHTQSPPLTSAVALVPSPCRHHLSFSSTTHFSIPSSLVLLSPFSNPVRCCAPHSPLSPLCYFCVRTLEERGPLPRRRVRSRPRPTAPTGDRVSVEPRAVLLLLGPPAGILEWPPRRVGALHYVFSLVTPPVGARGTVANRPLGREGLGGAAGYVPFLGPTAGCARRRHAKPAGLTVRFSLATPPVGACETGSDCPRGRSRCCGIADCVPLSGANSWDLRVAATPGRRSSLRISVCFCPRDS